MAKILLVIIYLAFISLGLPDSLLGTAWPAIQTDWQLPLELAGVIALLLVSGTIVSSMLSGHIIARFGTAKVTLISCAMTGLALLGYSLAPSYVFLLIFAVPLSLGAGSVDTALNHYVALHYKAHHMNWLHSFWGVGATIGPMIMAASLASLTWRSGYRTISIIQLSLAIIFLLTLGIWPKDARHGHERQISLSALKKTKHPNSLPKSQKIKAVLQNKGLIFALLVFMFYSTVEISVGLWGSSYLIQAKQITAETAASWIAVYYGGITAGRFLSGFVSLKLSNKRLIFIGTTITFAGMVLMTLPLPANYTIIPLVLIGLGLAPIFPSMMHETPVRFGKEAAGAVIGYQMAFSALGGALFPPLFGVIANGVGFSVFPFLLIAVILAIFISVQRLYFVTIHHPIDIPSAGSTEN